MADTGSGFGRLLVAVYAVFAVSASARAGVQIVTRLAEAPVAYLLSAFAAVVYLVATVALARRGSGARRVATVAILVELAGVLMVGAASRLEPAAFPDATVWSSFGRGYGYVPLLLPLVGLWWLRHTSRTPAPRSGSPVATGAAHQPREREEGGDHGLPGPAAGPRAEA